MAPPGKPHALILVAADPAVKGGPARSGGKRQARLAQTGETHRDRGAWGGEDQPGMGSGRHDVARGDTAAAAGAVGCEPGEEPARVAGGGAPRRARQPPAPG